MTPEEATMCLRTCVQNILGEPRLEVAQDFASFRRQLEEQTFEPSDDKVVALVASPYFYRKTTLSVLLSLLKTAHGAQLEHAVRNTNTFLSALWCELRKPERWQAGQTYAELYAEGKKPAVAGLKESLIRVSGFDYVPENLRSSTFTAAAKAVLDAHEAFNNFYNEPAPMSVLASLGTTIPSPAFPVCMTATLSVRLGNMYGRSTSAQGSAMKILRGLSQARWTYYLNECLPSDRQVLFKLTQEKPMSNWCDLVAEMGLSSDIVTDSLIQKLLEASAARNIHNLRGLTGAILRKQGQAR
jgi:hypothetical protein